jgi:hypothetical protein
MGTKADDRAGLSDVVRLADWHRSGLAPSLSPSTQRTDNPADFHELAVPNNLPIQRTSFIGREESLADVRRLLTQLPQFRQRSIVIQCLLGRLWSQNGRFRAVWG